MKPGCPVSRQLLVVVIASVFITWFCPANAQTLEETYFAALRNDADFLAANSTLEEAQSGVPLARAALLPQINFSVRRLYSNTHTNFVRPNVLDSDSGEYVAKSSAISLRQALFRKAAYNALQVAHAQADAATAQYDKERQSVAVRTVVSYLDVLAKRSAVTFAKKNTESTEALLTLAERSFTNGVGTRTDIADARARRDMARADETDAAIELNNASRNFQVVTGLSAGNIVAPDARHLNTEVLLLDDKEQWVQRAVASNPDVVSLEKQLEAADANVAQMRSGHLPSIDLVASYNKSLNETNTALSNPAEYTTGYVGLEINVPLFSGGSVVAQTNQAVARQERIRNSLESTRRKVATEAERLFESIGQQNEKVMALDQAIKSGEQAVVATKKGIQAGTRTFVDALDAERRLYQSFRDQTVATYTMLSDRFKFLALAGAIDHDNISMASVWLAEAAR